MHKRHHAQRRHIVHSLDGLLYQLHTISFFLSPSVWTFILRLISQFQCSKPRELDSTRPLRFFFAMVLLLNIPTIWNHAIDGAVEGRGVVLDFVGLAHIPSRVQLLSLDIFIILLQLVLTTIAYETSLFDTNSDSNIQEILPSAYTTPTPPHVAKSNPLETSPEYVIDLQFSQVLARLRKPAPATRPDTTEAQLPLPNTTPWPLPASMRMLMRGDGDGSEGRIPGAMNAQD
ncbi:hypothetical protein BD779DRAFT_1503530 [Infundibulicybe gibba]|nr:hypothetical protein BD779DRAFT_1503530 [Infundibulicybe gibba]